MPFRVLDAFKSARDRDDAFELTVGDEIIPMLLSYKAVRGAAKDWRTYSSDAPFRVPIPSEERERSVRQLPIETDPPDHRRYRSLIEPFFRRPMEAHYVARIDSLIVELISDCAKRPLFDVVRDFALPIQSRALTYMLGVPETEAETWIGWGTHVFRDGADSEQKGTVLEDYLVGAIQAAETSQDAHNFFAALNQMEIDGRPLSAEEKLGISNLVFAGGRDTVINAISVVMSYFAQFPEHVSSAASDQKSINMAVEEFIRVISPLTHIGRVNRGEDNPGSRVSLCWAAANYDPNVFQSAEAIDLARSPNPHVGFGSGHHACLGAPQARAILRSLIRNLSGHVASIKVEEEIANLETFGSLKRQVGFKLLAASISLLNKTME